MKNRKRMVGTLSTGIVFILFGIFFLAGVLFKDIDYKLAFSFWPAILILLGTELVISFVFARDENLKYDKGAIFLLLLMTLFTIGMATVDFILKHDLTKLNIYN